MILKRKFFELGILVWAAGMIFFPSSLWAVGKRPPQDQGANAPAPPAANGNPPQQASGAPAPNPGGKTGTIWDQVPPGGSIRAEKDGSWTVLDKNMNPVGAAPAGQTAPPAGKSGNDWSPDKMKGTIWDKVPEGGSIRANSDGTWTILDKNMNPVTDPPPAGTTEPAQTGGTPPAPPLPPPLVTPMPNGGVMTSQPQADGSWTHHYRREDPDGIVDYEIKPTDDAFPHEDPRFWKPGQTSPDRIITRTPSGGKITSVRKADGTWTHTYESADGNVNYRLKPDDDLYPKDDPRFQDPNKPADPFGDKIGMGSTRRSSLSRDAMSMSEDHASAPSREEHD